MNNPSPTKKLTTHRANELISGLSIVELIVTIGILAIVAGTLSSNYFQSREAKTLEAMVRRAVTDLRGASSRSLSQQESSQWGIHFENSSGDDNDFYWLWYGTSYASGTKITKTPLSRGVRFSDPANGTSKDVIFNKATGLPSVAATIIFESVSLGTAKTITVDSTGRIDF